MPHTCLVVTDDEVFSMLEELLAAERRTIVHAPTGAAALRWLSERRTPTIVLLDLPLADMSGSEFVESVGDDGDLRQMVAIVCLAGANARVPALAFRAIRKPSTVRELMGAIVDARRQLAVCGVGVPESALDRYLVWRAKRVRSALI